MNKRDWIIIFTLFIVAILVSSLVSVAASGHLFDSNEVVYDNTSSGMSSTNVKAAVDELYAAASDYSNINSRVTSLENKYKSNKNLTDINAIELNENGTLSNFGGYVDFHYDKSSTDYTSRIIETASGKLEVQANNGLKVNNTTITDRGISLGKDATSSYGYLDVYYAGQLVGNLAPSSSNKINIAGWRNGTAGAGQVNLIGSPVTINDMDVVLSARNSWGTKISFKVNPGGSHVLLGISNSLYMMWIAGSPPSINLHKIYGADAAGLSATLDGSIVSVKTSGNNTFSAFIMGPVNYQ